MHHLFRDCLDISEKTCLPFFLLFCLPWYWSVSVTDFVFCLDSPNDYSSQMMIYITVKNGRENNRKSKPCQLQVLKRLVTWISNSQVLIAMPSMTVIVGLKSTKLPIFMRYVHSFLHFYARLLHSLDSLRLDSLSVFFHWPSFFDLFIMLILHHSLDMSLVSWCTPLSIFSKNTDPWTRSRKL